MAQDGVVRRVDKTGATGPSDIATGLGCPTGIAVNEVALYWMSNAGLTRLVKSASLFGSEGAEAKGRSLRQSFATPMPSASAGRARFPLQSCANRTRSDCSAESGRRNVAFIAALSTGCQQVTPRSNHSRGFSGLSSRPLDCTGRSLRSQGGPLIVHAHVTNRHCRRLGPSLRNRFWVRATRAMPPSREPCARSHEPDAGPQTAPASLAPPPSSHREIDVYRFDFVLAVNDGGTNVPTTSFTLILDRGKQREMLVGKNIPLSPTPATGPAPQFASPRQDVGIKVAAQFRGMGDDVLLDVSTEMSAGSTAVDPKDGREGQRARNAREVDAGDQFG